MMNLEGGDYGDNLMVINDLIDMYINSKVAHMMFDSMVRKSRNVVT